LAWQYPLNLAHAFPDAFVAAQRELTEMAARARAIEAKEGEAARIAFERDFKQAQVERAATKVKAVQQLKRELLEQGFCPIHLLIWKDSGK
jgi:hypothetical protein